MFPNIQSKPLLMQLEAISSRLIANYLGEETDSHLSTTSFQLRCPSLDTLQHLNVLLVLRGPKLNTVFKVQPHQCQVQGHDHFPSPAGHTIPDTSQDAVGFLGHLGTLPAHVQPAVNQHLQPVPMLDNPFSEVKFPNIQSKPPLVQLEAISSRPIICYLGEETHTHLSTTSFQLCCPSLDTLQHLNVFLLVRGPKLNTVFEVQPHQCRVQGDDRFHTPASHTIFDTSQDAIGFVGHLGTLLAHIQPAVNQEQKLPLDPRQLNLDEMSYIHRMVGAQREKYYNI
ncbi:hypothetical protein QYF61_007656 [Mycteria americana]|uniref:Uncharacterized protein n=1 Tax=Mycteria americana TaxID=33587 RepID=A0AAN7NM45_MYCAM|nr:hypothetical protein QYF61_007656 [Mycteria americana]